MILLSVSRPLAQVFAGCLLCSNIFSQAFAGIRMIVIR